jgi:hypothetical protein
MVSGQARDILLQASLSGILARTSLMKGLAVIPRHPGRRILGQLFGVFLQFDEVFEGIGVVQFAGMDQAHEQISHLRAVLGLIEQAVLATTENFP